MKTSLLLMSLVMGAGLVGTAQAATTSAAATIPNVPAQALVATSMSSDGVLSTLSELLASKATKKTATAQPCDRDDSAGTTDKPKPCPSPAGSMPGAMPGAVNPHPQRVGGSNDPSHPDGDGHLAPSPASSAEATLGWQSLLPGSIQ